MTSSHSDQPACACDDCIFVLQETHEAGPEYCGQSRDYHVDGPVDHDWLGRPMPCPVHSPQPTPAPTSVPAAAGEVLREVEWSCYGHFCPMPECGGHKPTKVCERMNCTPEQFKKWRDRPSMRHGHAPDCRLAAALRAEDALAERALTVLESVADDLDEIDAKWHEERKSYSVEVLTNTVWIRGRIQGLTARIRAAVEGRT